VYKVLPIFSETR